MEKNQHLEHVRHTPVEQADQETYCIWYQILHKTTYEDTPLDTS